MNKVKVAKLIGVNLYKVVKKTEKELCEEIKRYKMGFGTKAIRQ